MADFAEFIQNEIRITKEIKTDFLSYFQRSADPTFITSTTLYNKNIETAIRLLIQKREALQNTCAVFPMFVEYAIVHTILVALNCSVKTCQTAICDIDKRLSLKCFLESMCENATIFDNNLSVCDQWIIPLFIDYHFTVAVIKFDKKSHLKFAFIKYYDSCGDDLPLYYQQQLITFFKHLGYNVKYQCIAEDIQKDNYNCGIFVTLKAIDIANSNINHPERLLKIADNDYEYHQNIAAYRQRIAHLLKENGVKVEVSKRLKEALDNVQKICF